MPVNVKNIAELMSKGWSWRASGTSVSPDWNQSDPTAADYVKNRTHWDAVTPTLIVDNVAVEVDEYENIFDPFVIDNLVPNNTYMVTFDGTDYECVAYEREGMCWIGNFEFYGPPDVAGNGEPFLINTRDGSSMMYTSTGLHTVSITAFTRNLQPLDPKYLPIIGIEHIEKDTYATAHGGPIEIQKQRRYIYMGNAPYGLILEDNTKCIIDVVSTGSIVLDDGTEYFGAGAQTIEATSRLVIGPYGKSIKINEYIPIILAADGSCFKNIYEISVNVDGVGGEAYINKTMPETYTGSISVEFTVRVPITTRAVESITLWSSTEGSTKRFKVTVDDSGTPTITNVDDPTKTWTPTAVTDDHINTLIDAKLGVIENGSY